ncbi:MAG: oxygen-independent coproporphyrinogen III oxidase [Nevskia sp.]|nr:oxygen-independent coproporphyrinogen III oxidase [Nevskia sp.]
MNGTDRKERKGIPMDMLHPQLPDTGEAAESSAANVQKYQAEAMRRAQEALGRAAALADADGTIRTIFNAQPQLLGYGAASFAGRMITDFVHPNDRRRVGRALAGTVAGDDSEHLCKLRLVQRDGSVRRVWILYRALLGRPGIDGILGVARDVTDMNGRLRTPQGAAAVERLLRGDLQAAIAACGEQPEEDAVPDHSNAARPSLDLIRSYDLNGPRYTSYPTALQFTPQFGLNDYLEAAARSNAHGADAPLSLYVHIPFCISPCFYCACTKIITSRNSMAEDYLKRLELEAELQGRLFSRTRVVEQLHFGGGTPTYLSIAQLQRLFDTLRRSFALSDGAGREFSIELDPRTIEPATLPQLAALGFNRASFGIQDFDPAVQEAVNRMQTYEQVADQVDAARRAGFNSLSFDLIYGLPKQNRDSFATTLERVISLRPDRISAYSYAHLPQRFKPQRQIRAKDLPDADTKLGLLELTIERLLDAGYVYIGMDHFALPGDELATALRAGTLQRNFQGYSTRGGLDLVGLGMSSIGRLGEVYSQNARTVGAYQAALDAGRLPVERGVRLSQDDCIRRDVIGALMCGGRLDYAVIEDRYELDFGSYFAAELRQMEQLERDGLVETDQRGLTVTDTGRYLLRVIAMPFDAYLPKAAAAAAEPRFSRVI